MLNELRLGNWVKWSPNLIIEIRDENIAYRTYLKLNENRVKPIEITYEVATWVSNKPFPKWDEGWITGIDLFDNREGSFIELDNNYGVLTVSIRETEEESGNLSIIKLPHIKHLHQLQNLYYSLTGKELIINRP